MDSFEPIVHTVEGETLTDCIRRIEEIHSTNYTISGKREIRYGGFLGFFQKPGVQVKYILKKSTMQASMNPYRSSYQQPVGNFLEEKNKILEKSNINPQMQTIIESLSKLESRIVAVTAPDIDEHPTVVKIQEYLEVNDFSASYIFKITDRLRKTFSLNELEDFDEVQSTVVDWIGESITIHKSTYTAKPQIILLVGPTGVGKTTTIAKLAARFIRSKGQQSKSVSLITVDSYRIAAVEQIKVYGEHMDIPVALAETNDDVRRLIDMHKTDSDIIMIDTIGFSPKDYESIGKMRNLLSLSDYPVVTYLTLSASTKISDMKEIMNCYEMFSYDSLIITKFDETNNIGNVISALSDKNKSVTYITTGQAVPRCFEEASISRLLFELKEFKIDKERIMDTFSLKTDA